MPKDIYKTITLIYYTTQFYILILNNPTNGKSYL